MIGHFLKYYKNYKILLGGVIAGTFTASALDLLFPAVVRDLIARVLPSGNISELWTGRRRFSCCMWPILRCSTRCPITGM